MQPGNDQSFRLNAEREQALKYLAETRAGVVAAVNGLSEAQMRFKPAPERWSVADTLEHITLTECFFVQNVRPQLKRSPAALSNTWVPDTATGGCLVLLRTSFEIASLFFPHSLQLMGQRLETLFGGLARHCLTGLLNNPWDVEAVILARIRNRATKYQAPLPLVPRGRWTAKKALNGFLKGREQTVNFLKGNSELRLHSVNHPAVGPLDGHVWILALAAHSERHTKQILEVKADPNFPVN